MSARDYNGLHDPDWILNWWRVYEDEYMGFWFYSKEAGRPSLQIQECIEFEDSALEFENSSYKLAQLSVKGTAFGKE